MKTKLKLVITIFVLSLGNHLLANNIQGDLNVILKSPKLETLFKTYDLTSKNLDLANYSEQSLSHDSSVYRFTVHKNNNTNFITVIKSNNQELLFIYEKNNLGKDQNGYVEQYDENGNFLLDYKITKLQNGKLQVIQNDFIKSKRLNVDSTNKLNVLAETWLQCVRRIQRFMIETCLADDVCGLACDLSPNCAAYTYAIAAARCTADGK